MSADAASGRLIQRIPAMTYAETYTVEYQNGAWIVTLNDLRQSWLYACTEHNRNPPPGTGSRPTPDGPQPRAALAPTMIIPPDYLARFKYPCAIDQLRIRMSRLFSSSRHPGRAWLGFEDLDVGLGWLGDL